MQYLEENARILAGSLGITDPPQVEASRLIDLSEWASTQAACLAEEGYNVSVTTDGEGLSYPPLTDAVAAAAFNMAIFTCEVRYPVDPKYTEPLTDERLRILYTYRSTTLIECLEDAGYPPSSSPPSKSVFIESGGAWSPYEDISVAQERYAALSAACPQVPEDFYDE
ncbi:hypothetical protein [Microbacterium sp. 18062]|uniref:hypothetical protein n=1 Tax=Microbacterium sp. 18062 TaxID=2681410 RepID=UPI00135CC288|nr:hypothetical protein [Microbacterium sp. 18062]